MHENKVKHVERKHEGDKNVKFKIHNDSKQPKLQFLFSNSKATSKKDYTFNQPSNSQKVEYPAGSDLEKFDEVVPMETNDGDTSDRGSNIEENIEIISPLKESAGKYHMSEHQQITGADYVVKGSSTVEFEGESPKQPKLETFDPKLYGDHLRDFQITWYEKFPWIHYDTQSSSVSCFPCQKYLNDNHFSFNNWKKPERLKKHSSSQTHLMAMTKWLDSKVAISTNNSILIQLNSQHASEVARNREYLRILIETTAHLGKQNVSFRGHNEDRSKLTELSSDNRGNFLELLNLQSKNCSFLKERLKVQSKNKTYGEWTSGPIQNELISLLAEFTQMKIIDAINNDVTGDNVIGVIADETSDISRHEQISLVISYIDKRGQKAFFSLI